MVNIFVSQNIIVPEVIMEIPLTIKDTIKSIYDILLTGTLTDKGKNEYINLNITV